MLVKMYINAHYICAMCRNSKSVAKKVAIFNRLVKNRKELINTGKVGIVIHRNGGNTLDKH